VLRNSIRFAAPHLADNEIHIWSAALERAPRELEKLSAVLSADEQARAERFRFQRDQEHFIAARGILRHVLAAYLHRQAAELRFAYSPSRKPALADADPGGLCFNLSHSHGLAVYAMTRHREIGVDVERLRSDFPCERIAERFFSPREFSKLRSLPEALRIEAFFNCWTRKEAYIKAIGTGLFMALDRFEVSLAPEDPAALLNVEDDPQEASRWTIESFLPAPGYVGAVAVKDRGLTVKSWRWKE